MAHARLFAFAILIAQASAQCYLEDTSLACSVCWKTIYADAGDSVGVTKMSECSDDVAALYDKPPPTEMFEGEGYDVTFSLRLNTSVWEPCAPGATCSGDKKFFVKTGEKEEHVPHANVHSCIASRGACTPFVANTPGLSTHTPASSGQVESDGTSVHEGNVDLDEDTYIIIAHIRMFEQSPTGKPTKIDVATGIKRTVIKRPIVNKISEDAYIMMGVVGFIILLFFSVIFYTVSKGILDLDKIMAMLFSDVVTLPVDIVSGLADVAAFTISCALVLKQKNLLTEELMNKQQALLEVAPICWLFCGVAWAVSIFNGMFDVFAMYNLYTENTNPQLFELQVMKRMSAKWISRRPSQVQGADRGEKKELVKRLSEEMQNMTGSSEQHKKAMHDFEHAERDFGRRKRTIVGIFLEGIPITVLQTYILIVGPEKEAASVLALLLAALLLGTSMQGLGDYGHSKRRRENAIELFDSLFAGGFQDTAGRTSQTWKRNSVTGDAAAPGGSGQAPLAPPPQEPAPQVSQVVVIGTSSSA